MKVLPLLTAALMTLSLVGCCCGRNCVNDCGNPCSNSCGGCGGGCGGGCRPIRTALRIVTLNYLGFGPCWNCGENFWGVGGCGSCGYGCGNCGGGSCGGGCCGGDMYGDMMMDGGSCGMPAMGGGCGCASPGMSSGTLMGTPSYLPPTPASSAPSSSIPTPRADATLARNFDGSLFDSSSGGTDRQL